MSGDLPDAALLQRYKRQGAYTDCYCVDVPHAVTMADYVAAFYTTPLFKVERVILALLAGRRSSDEGARALALAQASTFAAWDVEARASDQLLLRDFLGRTRSWLMVDPSGGGQGGGTRLYFGSAVVPASTSAHGKASFGMAFHALKGFHHLYSKALLGAARRRLAGVRP
ncbi:MAG: hypothetical protein WAQ08_18720 [Aquabacterium sp.]|jgi:hypothetical protein|uniref:hypothetical protein n=1 Tax=Aquabacterium sp. TaxID=1872578 RepID=UPI003BAE5B55